MDRVSAQADGLTRHDSLLSQILRTYRLCWTSSSDAKSLRQNNPLGNHDRQASSLHFFLAKSPIKECFDFVPGYEPKLFHICLCKQLAEELVKWAVNRE